MSGLSDNKTGVQQFKTGEETYPQLYGRTREQKQGSFKPIMLK